VDRSLSLQIAQVPMSTNVRKAKYLAAIFILIAARQVLPAVAHSEDSAKALELLRLTLACPAPAMNLYGHTDVKTTYELGNDADKLIINATRTEYYNVPEAIADAYKTAGSETKVVTRYAAPYSALGDVSIEGNELHIACKKACLQSGRCSEKCVSETQLSATQCTPESAYLRLNCQCTSKASGEKECTDLEDEPSSAYSFDVSLCNEQIENARFALQALIDAAKNSKTGSR